MTESNDIVETRTIAERVRLPTASQYQIAIFEAIENAVNHIMKKKKPDSLIVNACPGSGKTTTIIAATRLIPDELSIIFVAFNTKIATELETRLPIGVPAKTFHAHWFRQWSQHTWMIHHQSCRVDRFKVKNAVEKRLGVSRFQRVTKNTTPVEAKNLKKLRQQVEDVCFFVEKAKMHGVVPRGYPWAKSVGNFDDDIFFWGYLCEHFGYEISIEDFDEIVEHARAVLVEGLDNELCIDFNDMLYLPATRGIIGEKYHIVLIDEAQDLNHIQLNLLKSMIENNGMIIAVGDRNQSVYGFAGVDVLSMESIEEEFSCTNLPLSISYRCPKSVVQLAREIYPVIEEHMDNPEGSVEYPEKWKVEDFIPGQFVICRNNAPLVKLCYKLIKSKIAVKILGRDIGEGLKKLVKKFDADGSLVELITRLVQWKEKQIDLIRRKEPDDERSISSIIDKFESISVLAQNSDIKNVTDLIATIDEMFTNLAEEKEAVSPSRVTLSTIHKAKGLEADTVFILDQHLISPYWIKQDWEFVQESNIRFVAYTRSKNRLVFIHSDNIV